MRVLAYRSSKEGLSGDLGRDTRIITIKGSSKR